MDIESQKFSQVASNASNSIYALNSDVRRLQRLCNRRTASSNLSTVVANVANKCQTTSQLIEALNRFKAPDLNGNEKRQQTQIAQEFNYIVKEIASLQQKATILLREQVTAREEAEAAATGPSAEGSDETSPLIQVLDQLDQGSVDLHQQLIEERELEIAEVQRGMTEINAIFSDLGTLIQEQGAQLDTVEDHVTDVAVQTNSAARELNQANEYQRRRGRWSCYCLMALLVITILVGLTVVR